MSADGAGDGEGSLRRIGRHAGSVLLGNAGAEILTSYAVVLAAVGRPPTSTQPSSVSVFR